MFSKSTNLKFFEFFSTLIYLNRLAATCWHDGVIDFLCSIDQSLILDKLEFINRISNILLAELISNIVNIILIYFHELLCCNIRENEIRGITTTLSQCFIGSNICVSHVQKKLNKRELGLFCFVEIYFF